MCLLYHRDTTAWATTSKKSCSVLLQVEKCVAKHFGSDNALAATVCQKLHTAGLTALTSNPLALGYAAPLLANDSNDGNQISTLLDSESSLYSCAIDKKVSRACSGEIKCSASLRLIVKEVLQLGEHKLRRFLAVVMLRAHEAQTQEIGFLQVRDAIVAVSEHGPTQLPTIRLTAAVWLCARARLIPPLEPRGDHAIGASHLSLQETLVAEELLNSSHETVLSGMGNWIDESWWHPVVIYWFEQLRARGKDRDANTATLLDFIARRHYPLAERMEVEYFDCQRDMYLTGIIAATPTEDSAEIQLRPIDQQFDPPVGFERCQLRRVQVAGAAPLLLAAAAAGATELVKGLTERGVDAITSVTCFDLDSALHLAVRAGHSETARFCLDTGCWESQTNRVHERPDIAFASCSVVAARAPLSRLFLPSDCDVALAKQRQYDSLEHDDHEEADENALQMRAAADARDVDEIRRLLPSMTARTQGSKLAPSDVAYNSAWSSQSSFPEGTCVYAEATGSTLWRRGIVNSMYSDGRVRVLFTDDTISDKLQPGSLRLDDRSDCEMTPLMVASYRGFIDIVDALLEPVSSEPDKCAAAVTERTLQRGSNALHFAVVADQLAVATILVRHGGASLVMAAQRTNGARCDENTSARFVAFFGIIMLHILPAPCYLVFVDLQRVASCESFWQCHARRSVATNPRKARQMQQPARVPRQTWLDVPYQCGYARPCSVCSASDRLGRGPGRVDSKRSFPPCCGMPQWTRSGCSVPARSRCSSRKHEHRWHDATYRCVDARPCWNYALAA